jgi:TolB-like protein
MKMIMKKKWLLPLFALLMLLINIGTVGVFAAEEDSGERLSDVVWNDVSYDAYAERMAGMKLYKTDNTVQFYNTFIDESRLTESTTIDSLFDSSQEGYSTELLMSLNPVQLTESAPVYKGEDGAFYVVSSIYEMNEGLDPRDSQPATSFYNYLAEAFTDVKYVGKGVFRIPAERYEYCFNGHYYTDGPEGNLIEVVFGLRIQSLYGYDPETMPATKKILVTVTEDGNKRTVPGTMNMGTGTIEVRLLSPESEKTVGDYSIEAVVNLGESAASVMSVSEDGQAAVFTAGDSHAIGAFDVALSSSGSASTGLITPPVILTNRAMLKGATKLAASSTSVVNNITYMDLPAGCVPANLAVGDKFIYQKKNVYIAAVQNASDPGNYNGRTGTYNGTNPGTNLHIGTNNIPTHDAQWFCYYNNLSNWSAISNWFKQNSSGYSALNDPTKPDTNTAIANSMRQMTTANMNARAQNNGTTSNLGGARIFGYVSEKLGSQKDTTGTKTLNLNQNQLIFGCMHAWAYEGSTTPTAVGQALATFAGTSEIAHDQYCGNYYPNLALQCTSVTKDGNYTNATFKCCTSILGVGGMYDSNRNNYQCAFATLYVRFPNPTGEITVKKVWDDEDNEYYTRPNSVTMTLWSDADGTFKSTGKTVTLTSSDNWAAKKFTGLQIYRNGSSTTKVKYYVVETGATGYQISYSVNNTTYNRTASSVTVNDGGTLYVKNTFRDIPDTPYGVTTVSKIVRSNGEIVPSDDEFLFRIDIQYRAETTDGLKRTDIADYSHFVAIRYYKTGQTNSTLAAFTSESIKNSIVFDNSKKVSLYCVLKHGESVEFRIYDKGSKVDITELSASDSDLISVARFLNKTDDFSDRYIASMSSIISKLQRNADGTFTWLVPALNGSKANDKVLMNLTASFTVDADRRSYDFVNDSTYELTVRKVISGSMASRADRFRIRIQLTDSSDNPVNGTFNSVTTWETENGGTESEEGTVTSTNGVITITLRAGSSVTVKGIPAGVKYKVTEDDYSTQGYKTTYQKRSGTITKDTTATVVNERESIVPTGVDIGAMPLLAILFTGLVLMSAVLFLDRRKRRTV